MFKKAVIKSTNVNVNTAGAPLVTRAPRLSTGLRAGIKPPPPPPRMPPHE